MNKIEFRGPLMIVRFPEPHICWSWAVVNGGRVRSEAVAWYFLAREEYPELENPGSFLRSKLEPAGLGGAVGLITSRKRYGQVEFTANHGDARASCVATTGLRNAMRIGDAPTFVAGGTTNLLCTLSTCLTDECALEAIAMAAEARTAAMMDAGTGATGSGTDCIVVAYPPSGPRRQYAGKHTSTGHVIGRAVYDAVLRGIKEWQRECTP